MKKIVGISLIVAIFIFAGCKKNVAPTCSITEPSEGEIIIKGSVYTLKGEAYDADGNLANVGFYIDNNGVGSTFNTNYLYNWDTDKVRVGSHTIALIAVDEEGENATTYNKIEIVDSDPDPDFVADFVTIMVGDTVKFTDLSLNYPAEWSWNFGDDNVSSDQNPYHIYDVPGIYSVSLTVSNTSGSSTETKTDYITASKIGDPPIAGFSVDTANIEAGSTVIFSDLSANAPTSWLWEFGDGGSSSGQNPSYTYYNSGIYTVQLTVENDYGTATEVKEDFITVNIGDSPPICNFVADQTSINAGDVVIFTDLSSNSPTNWLWDFGDGNTSSTQSPQYIYTIPGTFSVTLTVSNNAGSDTKTITDYIQVNSLPPVADFVADTTNISVGNTLYFTDLSENGPDNWTWDFGDGTTATSQNPSHIFYTSGTFTISLTVSNPSGSDTEIKTDYVEVIYEIPEADYYADQTVIEEGQTVTFTDISSNFPDSWDWDFGDGGASLGQNPSYTYMTSGTYTVSLTSSNIAGSDTEIKEDYIVVNPSGGIPVADFIADETIVNVGNDIGFIDLSSNAPTSWLWDFGDGETSTDQNPFHVYLSPGLYSVSLTAMNINGSNTHTKTDYITITGIPEADFIADSTTIIAGESINFSDLSINNPDTWLWDFGDGGTSQGQNPIYTYSTAGIYTVSLTATNSYGLDTETKIDYIIVNTQ